MKRCFSSWHYFFYSWLHFLLLLSFPNSYLALEMSNVNMIYHVIDPVERFSSIIVTFGTTPSLATNTRLTASVRRWRAFSIVIHAANNAGERHWRTCYEYLGNLLTEPFRSNFHTQVYADIDVDLFVPAVFPWLYVNVLSWSLSLHIDNFVSSFQDPRQNRK